MKKLNIGSGVYLVGGYINVDSMFTEEEIRRDAGKKGTFFSQGHIERGAKFIQANILKLPFPDNYADITEAHQILEHLRWREIIPALKELYRVTKKGGKILISTPNFDNLCLQWINMIGNPQEKFDYPKWKDLADCFYGYQANEGETHRNPITPSVLAYYLGLAGYANSTAGVTIFPINAPVPDEGYGLIGNMQKKTFKKFGRIKGVRVFRCETLYMEITKN